jgi:hypothetical protein
MGCIAGGSITEATTAAEWRSDGRTAAQTWTQSPWAAWLLVIGIAGQSAAIAASLPGVACAQASAADVDPTTSDKASKPNRIRRTARVRMAVSTSPRDFGLQARSRPLIARSVHVEQIVAGQRQDRLRTSC